MLKKANLPWSDVAFEHAKQWLDQFKHAANEEKAQVLEMHELKTLKGSVHDQNKMSEVIRLNFDYPGTYVLHVAFAKTWLKNPNVFEPNLDVSVGHQNKPQNAQVWLGDLDAAFNAKSLDIEVNYLGYGRYEINNHYFDQAEDEVCLYIDAFDTNEQWIQFELKATQIL